MVFWFHRNKALQKNRNEFGLPYKKLLNKTNYNDLTL